jgi:putative IMPACT (imprinted ancient) family translation regulator
VLEDGQLCCSYDVLAAVEAVLADLNAEIRDISYASEVCVHFGMEKEVIAKLQRRLQDVSRGTLEATFPRFT